jgi:hypothetical protein
MLRLFKLLAGIEASGLIIKAAACGGAAAASANITAMNGITSQVV